MRSKLATLAFTAALVVAMALTFSCSSNDDNGGGGGGGGGDANATFTMRGNDMVSSQYCLYYFKNYSSFNVKVTINGETKTMPPYAPSNGKFGEASFNINSLTASVTYSPANKVRYEADVFYSFFDK